MTEKTWCGCVSAKYFVYLKQTNTSALIFCDNILYHE